MAIAGCGGDHVGAAGAPPPKARVPLAASPPAAGEVILKGEASPRDHGPLRLDGRYRVRFQQTAPEDPSVDFRNETPFVARIVPAGSHGRGRRLFRAAAAHGERNVTLHGRFDVDVEFGDWPYAIRFTPLR